jgi:hypothetical protein
MVLEKDPSGGLPIIAWDSINYDEHKRTVVTRHIGSAANYFTVNSRRKTVSAAPSAVSFAESTIGKIDGNEANSTNGTVCQASGAKRIILIHACSKAIGSVFKSAIRETTPLRMAAIGSPPMELETVKYQID